MIGLGCMRLSTVADRDDERSINVIHAALDSGATMLDTANSYCHDESDIGHNESHRMRLAIRRARALRLAHDEPGRRTNQCHQT